MRVIQVFSQGPQGIPGRDGREAPFFIKSDDYNTWYTTSSILVSSSLQVQSNSNNLFIVKGSLGNAIFSVTQSGYVVIGTQSAELANPAPYGGMYFTSNSFFVGLE